jgi:hypothetical protein
MRRHITYANVTATLALVFAMSGGALAAKHYLVTKTNQISPKVLQSLSSTNTALFKKLSKSVTVAKASSAGSATTAGSATNAANATNATHATSANTATSATTATNATNATTASNALSLGGTPASGFTKSDCASQTGQVKGFVTVPASEAFSGKLTPVGGYNCSGQAVEALRRQQGEYEVKFAGNPATIAVGTVNSGNGFPFVDLVSVESVGGGTWHVAVWNPNSKEFRDDPFQLLVP